VIAATGSALDEAVGDDGVRVNPFDVEAVAAALKDLLADATLRQSLRERGFARARRFSWDQTAARTWQVLEASDD
jgi:glycosyltransferase involved in cell wall biosynthesis